MFRNSLFLVILIGAVSTSAHAQTGPGTIYYQYPDASSTNHVYRVSGDGTGNVEIGPYPWAFVGSTALTIYPGGRQFVTGSAVLGPIPGITDNYGDITLYSELNATPTTVTSFRGPQYVRQDSIRARFSNDQRDSFFSFMAYDTRTAFYIHFRYNGPISDIFQLGFSPFVSDDPRLVPVYSSPTPYDVSGWDSTGTKLTLTTVNAAGMTLIYIYDTTTDSLNLVNNPSLSGFNLTKPEWSSTEFRMFSAATQSNGTKGMVSFYPATGHFSWIIKEGGTGLQMISAFSPPAISPDGTVLALGILRGVNKKTVPSLVRIPVGGGSYTPLVNFPANTVDKIAVGGMGWKW